jgi:putative aldouronate transport system substrate-binding protein
VKKLFLLIITVLLAANLWAAGGSQRSPQSAVPVQNKANLTPLGKYSPAVEITLVQGITLAGDQQNLVDNNAMLDFFEEKLGIRIKHKWVTSPEQYNQRLALSLASNDLPDCMKVDMKTLGQMIDADQIEDLTQAWNIYGSDLTKSLMDVSGSTGFGMGKRNGRLYGIPDVTPVLETMHMLFLREDWRQKLKLPEPSTFENLERILYAFTKNDPDGNGIQDTYGIGMNKSLYGIAYEMTSIANAMHAYPNAWIRNPQGRIVYGSVQPEMKSVLVKLAQWFKDGLIDPEFTVKDENKEAELTLREKLGATFGVQWTQFISGGIVDLYITNPQSDWKLWPIPPIDASPAKPIVYDNTKNFFVVRKGYPNPEALVLLLNMMHQMGAGDSSMYFKTADEYNAVWEENRNFCPVRPESIHGNVPKWVNVFTALDTNNPALVEYSYNVSILYNNILNQRRWLASTPNPRRDGQQADKDLYKRIWGNLFSGQLFTVASGLAAKNELEYEQCGALVTDTMVESLATIQKLELETFTRIITGDAPISEFDNFVASWNRLGGQRITEEINQWYANN